MVTWHMFIDAYVRHSVSIVLERHMISFFVLCFAKFVLFWKLYNVMGR